MSKFHFCDVKFNVQYFFKIFLFWLLQRWHVGPNAGTIRDYKCWGTNQPYAWTIQKRLRSRNHRWSLKITNTSMALSCKRQSALEIKFEFPRRLKSNPHPLIQSHCSESPALSAELLMCSICMNEKWKEGLCLRSTVVQSFYLRIFLNYYYYYYYTVKEALNCSGMLNFA